MRTPSVVSFGEVLWDLFPDSRVIGGAPFNFASHLSKLGAEVTFISAVGQDDLGEAAAEQILAAIALCNTYAPLCLECAEVLIRAGRYHTLADLYETFPKHIRENGRMRMLLGTCYTKLSDFARAEQFVNESLVVADIREGEYALSNIWIELHAKRLAAERGVDTKEIDADEVLARYPLPYAWDYRMH